MNGWELPVTATISGTSYAVNTDYRDVLEIISSLQESNADEKERVYIALSLFYTDFETMPRNDWQEAFTYLLRFVDCGEAPEDNQPSPKRIDWEQDRLLIIADINKAAGYEVRAVEYMHWWTFVAWFHCIGEGQLSTVCTIRDKRRKGEKLDKWEQEYYREHKSHIDFRVQYTDEELAEREALLKLLGEE